MNKFYFSGKVYEEPVYSTSQKGKGVLKFKVAVTQNFKNKDGKYDSDFFDVIAFGSTADYAARNMEKGAIVNIEARVGNNNYTDKNGIKHYSYSFFASEIEIPYGRDAASVMAEHRNKSLAAKQNTNQNYSGKPDPEQLRQAQMQQEQEDEFVEVSADDLPF